MTDADISMDRLHSEGLRRWNTDMDIEYQYETFNGLPVYYSGDRYDSDDTKEFFPNAPEEMENMTCTQRRPDGGDNRNVNTVNMTPMCRTVLKGVQREVNGSTADESSDTSRTDTADLDYTGCQLETDVWDDMYCMEFEWNTRNDTYTWESENYPPDSVTVFPEKSAKEVVCYRDDFRKRVPVVSAFTLLTVRQEI